MISAVVSSVVSSVVSAQRARRFTRLETDTEFRERLRTLKRRVWTMTHAVHFHGEALDTWAWDHYAVQRRIVEDEA